MTDHDRIQKQIDETLELCDAATEGELHVIGCDVARPVPTIGTEWVQTGPGEEDGYPQQVIDGCEAEQVAHFGSEADAKWYVHAREMLPRYARALQEVRIWMNANVTANASWRAIEHDILSILNGESDDKR